MRSLLQLFFPQPPAPCDQRNRALRMAMDWNEEWHGPGRPRPGRTTAPEDVEYVAGECMDALQFGYELASVLAKAAPAPGLTLEEEFALRFTRRYPWATEENTQRLLRQGLEFAQGKSRSAVA